MNRLWLGLLFVISGVFIMIFPALDRENRILSKIALIGFGLFLIVVYWKYRKSK
jgi:uncharacterized membrane protein